MNYIISQCAVLSVGFFLADPQSSVFLCLYSFSNLFALFRDRSQ